MAKNKKLKLKQKQKQKQNQTVIVKVDNSRKTIRKGDTQPKQPKPPQQPIIINNQQPAYNPYMMNYQQPQQPRNITVNSPPINITNPPIISPPIRNNVDDTINAFSKTTDEKFNTLQEQLNMMNNNFRQASNNIMEKINPQSYNNNDSVQEQSTITPPLTPQPIPQPKATPKTPKTIIINDEPPKQQSPSQYISSTPIRAIQQLRQTPQPKESPGMNTFEKELDEIDNLIADNYKNPVINPQSQNNKQFNTPKIVPTTNNSFIVPYGSSTSQLDSYLQAQYKKREKDINNNTDTKIADFLQNEIISLDSKTEPEPPIEITEKKFDTVDEDKISERNKIRIEDATGPNREAEIYNCPYCSFKPQPGQNEAKAIDQMKSNLFRHMRSAHEVDSTHDKFKRDADGNKIMHRGEYVYIKKTRLGNVYNSYEKNIVEAAIANKQKLFHELGLRKTKAEVSAIATAAKVEKKNKAINQV